MKRINPADVPEIFRRLNIVPVAGAYSTRNRKDQCGACLVGILAADAAGWDKVAPDDRGYPPNIDTLTALAGLDFRYAVGLSMGWESNDPYEIPENIETTWDMGYEDGLKARIACGNSVVKDKDFDPEFYRYN